MGAPFLPSNVWERKIEAGLYGNHLWLTGDCYL